MSIIIPSKNIYNIENPKVIKNRIQSVKVGASSFSLEEKYNETVNQSATESFYEASPYGQITEKVISDSASGTGASRTVSALGIVGIIPTYSDILPSIKKFQKNKKVTKVFYGKDENGNADISYSIYGKKKTGTFTFPVTFRGTTADYNLENATATETESDKETVSISLPSPRVELSFSAGEKGNLYAEETIVATANAGNLTYPTVQKDDDKSLDLFISALSGLVIFKGSCKGEVSSVYPTQTVNFVGTYEIYEPTRAEMTINGNTVSLEIEDVTQTFGGTENPFSVEGNEFFQSIVGGEAKNAKNIADTILQNYSVGKETATIDCSISDYYDTDGKLAISTKNEKSKTTASLLCELKRHPNTAKELVDAKYTLTLENYAKSEVSISFVANIIFDSIVDSRRVVIKIPEGEKTAIFEYSISTMGISYPEGLVIEIPTFGTPEFVSTTSGDAFYSTTISNIIVEQEIPMCFQNGHIVIPQIFSSQGIDVPMSKKQSGEEKKFVVVGKELYYDGSVMQKLYLQEYDINT